ncbi:MAG: hypothetical protein MUP63_01770 [Candidatus Nanohaloarchaeota archaeon QJJ-7]|nr:hypothetical protein [Candidatus Nanohaloarchaeota archaeon QJJ-7]
MVQTGPFPALYMIGLGGLLALFFILAHLYAGEEYLNVPLMELVFWRKEEE